MLGIFEILILIGVFVFVSKYRDHWKTRLRFRPAAVRPAWIRELTWILPPVLVLGTFVGISLSGSPYQPVMRFGPTPAPDPQTPVPTDDRTVIHAEADRPDWVSQPESKTGEVRLVVVASQQYSTVEEAESELARTAADLLLADLNQIYSREMGVSTWHPTIDDIRRHVVKQQYVETIERDFGNFFHPMHRVWWQLEFSPEVRYEFAPHWRHGLTARRVHLVGGAATLLVALVSLIALYRRLNVVTLGQRKLWVLLLVAVVGQAWLGGAAVALRYWRSWPS